MRYFNELVSWFEYEPENFEPTFYENALLFLSRSSCSALRRAGVSSKRGMQVADRKIQSRALHGIPTSQIEGQLIGSLRVSFKLSAN